jgi:hypothetical protein
MALTPQRINPNDPPNLLPAVRELQTQYPSYQHRGAAEIAEGLFCLRYMKYRPHEAAVEAALEALRVDGAVLP